MDTDRRSFMKHVAAASAGSALGAARAGASPQDPRQRPSLVGAGLDELPTPCLVLRLDRLEANLAKMAAHARTHAISLRPHAKTHKSAEIARRQVGAGALGVCVATIAEAEMMARHGIRGLLITAELTGRPKIRRLLEVVRQAPDTMQVVDNVGNVRELDEALAAARLTLDVLIDLDVGSRRTGVTPGTPALELAQAVGRAPTLRLRGICAYAGHAAHVTGFEARAERSRAAMTQALETRDLLRQHGFDLEILTGGSTGTYNIDTGIDGITELQVGSYVFMDVDYRRIGGEGGAVYDDFAPALTVLTTVVHRSPERTIVDAGLKAFATDRRFGPEPFEAAGLTYAFMGDEHGRLEAAGAAADLALGDRVELIVPHCDPNVNLYDRYHVVQDGKVEAIWSVMDRAECGPYF